MKRLPLETPGTDRCPAEIAEVALEIVRDALLAIRAAGWAENPGYCALEADHVHNLPDLIRTYTQEKLDYYLDIERPGYLHQVRAIPERDVGQYEPLWEKLTAYREKIKESHGG